MSADTNEAAFQQDIIKQMIAGGWLLGDPVHYNRELALYTPDCLAYVQTTQPKMWATYRQLYPSNPAFPPSRPRPRGTGMEFLIDTRCTH